jgi:hypothetical protein
MPAAVDGAASSWVDCVDAVHVIFLRDYSVSNAVRLEESHPAIGSATRVSDLAQADLRAFCDWESCVRTNGYAHVCYANDAGWEQCRVCDGGADCDGRPASQDDCVAGASAPGRQACHVELLEECLLQRAIRPPTDARLTQTCYLSAQACAGELPGDLSALAGQARQETRQVAVEQSEREFALTLARDASTPAVASYWQQQFSGWDGGLPVDLAADGAPEDQ